MLPVSLELTLPESHRSGFSSCAALEATRISYALCLPPVSRQLRFGVASPSPIGLVNVFTRSVVAVMLPPAGSAGAPALTASGRMPAASSAASRAFDLIFSPLVLQRFAVPKTIAIDQTTHWRRFAPGKIPRIGKNLGVFPGANATRPNLHSRFD